MTAGTPETSAPRDAVSGAAILVGDMIAWSDLDGVTPPHAVRVLLDALLAQRRPTRVLLAGARAGLLLPALPEDARIEVLARSLDDVRRLEVLGAMHSRVSYYCGSFAAFEGVGDYDLVVALGGPQALLSPDQPGLSTAELLARLTERVTDGGLVVADLQNELGLTDLVAAVPDPARDDDSAWWIGADGFDTRATYAHERTALLAGAGLQLQTTYAALPDLQHASVLVRADLATDPARTDVVAALAARTVDQHLSQVPVLRDVTALLERITGAGMLDELAPAWLVLAAKGTSGSGPDLARTLPQAVGVDGYPQAWCQWWALTAEGNQERGWVAGSSDAERTEADLSRTLAAPPVQGGTLDAELRAALAGRRFAQVRTLVRTYAAWLGDADVWDESTSGQRVFATPRNVRLDDSGGTVLDPSWSRVGTLPATACLVRGLRSFATDLLASGAPHPWRAGSTPDELCGTLAAMAGVSVTEADIAQIGEVNARIESVIAGQPELLEEIRERELQRGRFARDLPSAGTAGYRELLTAFRSLASEMRAKDGQITWLEGTLRHRDSYIRKLEKTAERYEDTLTFRTVEALRTPRRIATNRAVNVAKATANDVLPPGSVSKARSLATRLLK